MLLTRSCTTAAVAAVLFAAAGTATAAPTASRFDDGSFEYPAVAANSFQSFAAGASMGPWKVTSGAADLIGAGFWQAAEGDQSLDLNATVPATVAQTFTTTPGKTYTVTYSLAGNPDGASPLKTGRALVDGQNFQDFSFDTAGKTRSNMGYVTRQFTFVANNPTTTLAFASTTPNSAHGPVIDDVRVHTCCSDSCCR
ncbi:choice-of-anchor C family protein [Streptomyces pini]|uniref:Choice-of-anchor C domain-containing protein n=1 Tax=Streptomyces pini TaxID=1520580 RepID=A0A1I4LZT4_9ACTN|nr:choice-of-anchor C family protein [Streptomyces pini]SFL96511.1 choice-of-anchor C domain-containing protein [Streptomyces pini]